MGKAGEKRQITAAVFADIKTLMWTYVKSRFLLRNQMDVLLKFRETVKWKHHIFDFVHEPVSYHAWHKLRLSTAGDLWLSSNFTVRQWLVKVESKHQERWRKWNSLYWCCNLWILLLPLENLAATHVRSHNGVFQEAAAVLECKIRPPDAEKGQEC